MGKKKFQLCLGIMMTGFLFAGCGEKHDNGETAYFDCGEIQQVCLTEDGCYIVDENEMLHIFDKSSGKTVMVCDKPECAHSPSKGDETDPCNAEINTEQFAVYKDKIYYLVSGNEYNTLDLRRRDLDGNHDEKVVSLEGEGVNNCAWFYEDTALVKVCTAVSKTFNAETKESDKPEARLYAVDLNSGKSSLIGSSFLTDQVNVFRVHKAEDGKFYYYSQEENAFYTYDTETGENQKRNVKCTADFTTEYHGMSGDYCYGYKDDYQLIRMNIETGEEEVFFTSEDPLPLNYYSCFSNYIAIYDYTDGGKHYVFQADSGELTEIESNFVDMVGLSATPMSLSENGVVYSNEVNQKIWGEAYDGDFEYEYMALSDYMDGSSKYEVIYYLKQED